MKFLLHGNAPHVRTGYGVQIANLAERLVRAGHDVAISSTYGQQGGAGIWIIPSTQQPVVVYPCGYEVNSNDIIHGHAQHFFDGDPKGGWIITCLDVWAMPNPLLADYQVAAWTPVDHFPAPPDVIKFFHRTGAIPVTMSRFGERLLFNAGLDPVYIPLSVDTRVYKPTPMLTLADGRELTARALCGIPEDAFVVGMVGMNKGWARDRKGFNEAFRAFGRFWVAHPEAVLYMHAEKFGGAEGINLVELAEHAAVPEHALIWCDQYAYRLGVPAEVMAATYTAMDVLLAPSHGEGFCVPLIEAQACGTPIIATDFSSQPELVGAGWMVTGQPEWDPAQHASYVCPSIVDVLDKLEEAYAADREAMGETAITFASGYDADRVFADYWQPFLARLEPAPIPPPSYDRQPIPETDGVAVIVPAMRPENLVRLIGSFNETNDGSAELVIVADRQSGISGDVILDEGRITSFAEKVNAGFEATLHSWVLLVGDDVVFRPGWIKAARTLSDRFDVIGTNDTAGEPKNPDVAAGRHADHFFVRRAYVEAEGGCLDGPGELAPTVYGHWHVDREMIELARARGVFTPCLESVVEHLHPGYDGREDLRQADAVYLKALDTAEADAKTFRSRLPLIHMQRVGARR
jgi:glycosyltransferase involved in cell wall biosynthesis